MFTAERSFNVLSRNKCIHTTQLKHLRITHKYSPVGLVGGTPTRTHARTHARTQACTHARTHATTLTLYTHATTHTPYKQSRTHTHRSAFVAEPSGSVELSGWLLGGSPKASSDRSPTFFPSCLKPPIRQSGLLRVHVTAQTLLRIEPDTTTSFDFYLNRRETLFEGDGVVTASPQNFDRSLQVAIFEQLCEEHGLLSPGPAPRGRFTPAIGSRAFFMAVATRGVGCHYLLCWPVGMISRERFNESLRACTRRALLSPSPSSGSSPSSASAPSSPDRQLSASSLPEWGLPQGASSHGPRA